MRVSDEGWQEFDITKGVKSWFQKSKEVLSLAVYVGSNVADTSQTLDNLEDFGFVGTGRHSSQHPFVVTAVGRKNDAPLCSSPFKPVPQSDPLNSKVQAHEEEQRYHDSKKSTTKPCQHRSYALDVKTFIQTTVTNSLLSNVISPTAYLAYYCCQGNCSEIYDQRKRFTYTHKFMGSQNAAPGKCPNYCGPTSLESMYVIERDPSTKNLIRKTVNQIKSCGCKSNVIG